MGTVLKKNEEQINPISATESLRVSCAHLPNVTLFSNQKQTWEEVGCHINLRILFIPFTGNEIDCGDAQEVNLICLRSC